MDVSNFMHSNSPSQLNGLTQVQLLDKLGSEQHSVNTVQDLTSKGQGFALKGQS